MDHCVHSECFMGLPISLWGDLKLTSSGGGGEGGYSLWDKNHWLPATWMYVLESTPEANSKIGGVGGGGGVKLRWVIGLKWGVFLPILC